MSDSIAEASNKPSVPLTKCGRTATLRAYASSSRPKYRSLASAGEAGGDRRRISEASDKSPIPLL